MAAQEPFLKSFVCGVTIVLVCGIPLPIANVIGVLAGDHDACDKFSNNWNLSLSDYLQGQTIAQFAGIVLLLFMLVWTIQCRLYFDARLPLTAWGVALIHIVWSVVNLFILAWSVLGSTILFRDNRECLHKGAFIGVLVLINCTVGIIHLVVGQLIVVIKVLQLLKLAAAARQQ